MHRFDMDDTGPAIFVFKRDAASICAHAIINGAGPSIIPGDDFDAIWTQSKQLYRLATRIFDNLDIAIAVQQQMSRQCFEKGLPGAGRGDKLCDLWMRACQRSLSDAF